MTFERIATGRTAGRHPRPPEPEELEPGVPGQEGRPSAGLAGSGRLPAAISPHGLLGLQAAVGNAGVIARLFAPPSRNGHRSLTTAAPARAAEGSDEEALDVSGGDVSGAASAIGTTGQTGADTGDTGGGDTGSGDTGGQTGDTGDTGGTGGGDSGGGDGGGGGTNQQGTGAGGGSGSFTKVGPATYSKYQVSGTLNDAANAIAARTEAGSTTPSPALDTDTLDDKVTAARITVGEAVELPEWTDKSSANAAQQAEWDRFYSAISSHEAGHVSTDQTAWAGAHTKMVGLKDADASTKFDEISKAADAANQAYDTANDHGKTQGTTINPNLGTVTKVP